MFKFLSKLSRKIFSTPKRTHRPAPRARLGIESLEDRLVATTTPVVNPLADPLSRATVRIESHWNTNGIAGLQRSPTMVNGRLVAADYWEMGSGAMITRNDVLTAGHAIHQNADTGGRLRADWVFVSPAQNGPNDRPFGTARGVAFYTPPDWRTNDINSDIGIIRLDRNLGNFTGTMHYGWIGANWLRTHPLPITVQHYPGNGNATQSHSTGTITNVMAKQRTNVGWNLVPGDRVLTYNEADIRTTGGSSGGPVTVRNVQVPGGYWGNVPTIIGVHARGFGGVNGAPNEATLITPRLFGWIQDTIRSGANNLADRADLMDYDFFFQRTTSRISRITARAGDPFAVTASLWNGGTATPGAPIRVRFFLSRDVNIGSRDDIVLPNDVIIRPGSVGFQQFAPFNNQQPAQAIWAGSLPANVPTGTYFVGWIVDPQNALQDYDRGNNTGIFNAGQLTIR